MNTTNNNSRQRNSIVATAASTGLPEMMPERHNHGAEAQEDSQKQTVNRNVDSAHNIVPNSTETATTDCEMQPVLGVQVDLDPLDDSVNVDLVTAARAERMRARDLRRWTASVLHRVRAQLVEPDPEYLAEDCIRDLLDAAARLIAFDAMKTGGSVNIVDHSRKAAAIRRQLGAVAADGSQRYGNA